MNISQTVEDVSMIDTNPLISPLVNSKLQLVHNTNWKTVEVNGQDITIPSAWDVKSIGSEIKFTLGHTPVKKGDNYNGKTPWITISNLDQSGYVKRFTALVKSDKTRVLPKGSLVGSFKMTIGRFGILEMDAITNEAIVGASPDDAPNHVLTYLRFALVLPFKQGAVTNGQGVQLLNTKTIKSLEFIAPPKHNQFFIAQTLTNQEDHIASLKQQSSIQRKRLDWLTDELLSGRIRVEEDVNGQPTVLKRDEHGNAVDSLPAVKLVANTDWKTVEVNGEEVKIPQDWECKMLKDVTTVVTGNTPSTNNQNYWTESSKSGIPWVTTPDIKQQNGIINYSNKYLTQHGAGVGRVCPKGTVLVSCIATIGEVGVLIVPASFNQQINGILPSILINSDYIRHFFFYHKTAVENMAVQSVVKIINKSTFEKFEILLPKIKEQTLIAKILTAQEEYIASLDQMIAIEEKRLIWLTDELLSGRILIQEVK